MAVYEKNALLTVKDEAGNRYLIYPITQLDCVDGAEDLLHYGSAQDLTGAEKAQARLNIGAMPTPATAKVGQFIRVAEVTESGEVTAVEAVEQTAGSATVDGETLIISGSIRAIVRGESLILS